MIEIVLPNELPGKRAHLLLAPEPRIKSLKEEQTPPASAKESAVLVLLNPSYLPSGEINHNIKEWNITFIQRNTYHGVHSGQIAFPGGKCEESDTDYVCTACREANEELGIEENILSIVGPLSSLYVPPSNFTIYPILAIQKKFNGYTPNPREVSNYLNIPLSLFDPQLAKRCRVQAGPYEWVHAPGYVIDNHVIWGATAMIMCELYQVVDSLASIKFLSNS